MKISKNNNSTKKTSEYPVITRHFAGRYYERILSKPVPKKLRKTCYTDIKEDMSYRMLDKEKMMMTLFSKANNVILPMARYYSIVVSNNKLITIY